jgi:hypothetical protein
MKADLFGLRGAAIAAAAAVVPFAVSDARAATVIELTQTGCQFVESENGIDHGFETSSAADCKRINAETGRERLAEAEPMELAPGRYVFRVTNENVPYPLGFWLRESDYEDSNAIAKLTKTSVSGGGLDTGKTRDYEVELEPGEYVYSCPLNPTPDYRLIVTAN